MIKPPWIEDLEADKADERIDSILTLLMIVGVVCFCAFALSLVYQLAQPWVAVLIGAMT